MESQKPAKNRSSFGLHTTMARERERESMKQGFTQDNDIVSWGCAMNSRSREYTWDKCPFDNKPTTTHSLLLSPIHPPHPYTCQILHLVAQNSSIPYGDGRSGQLLKTGNRAILSGCSRPQCSYVDGYYFLHGSEQQVWDKSTNEVDD